MTTQTATATTATGLSGWVDQQRSIISEWNAREARYNKFVTENNADTVAAFGAYIEDLAVHLDALEDPAITGLPNYSARDLLVEMRNLRNLNQNVVKAGGSGIVRRVSGSPRSKIRWGIAAGEGSAFVYSEVTDRTAKTLAIALKSDS